MWALESREKEVALLTRRLHELHDLLCGSSESFEEVDLGSMVSREPALLTAPVADMQRRLLLMRLTARQANIIALVQREPWLLVEGPLTWDQGAAAQAGAVELSWKHGVPVQADWQAKLQQLQAYSTRHGDVLVGSRPDDDASLHRWAGLQRERAAAGLLSAPEMDALRALEFEFDGAKAEWLGWWRQLADWSQTGAQARSSDTFLLTNWMSVQRVGRRCGVLEDWQIQRLDAIDFDWDAADPLS